MSGYFAELFLENVDQEFLCGIWSVNVIPAFFAAIFEFSAWSGFNDVTILRQS